MQQTTPSRPIPRAKLAAALKRNMARRKAVRGASRGEPLVAQGQKPCGVGDASSPATKGEAHE